MWSLCSITCNLSMSGEHILVVRSTAGLLFMVPDEQGLCGGTQALKSPVIQEVATVQSGGLCLLPPITLSEMTSENPPAPTQL